MGGFIRVIDTVRGDSKLTGLTQASRVYIPIDLLRADLSQGFGEKEPARLKYPSMDWDSDIPVYDLGTYLAL